MIVARRPFTIYATDLAYCAGLIAVLALGYVLLVQPGAQRRETLQRTRVTLADLRNQVEDRRAEIGRLKTEIDALKAGVTQRSADIPPATHGDATVQAVLASAADFGVEFQQIIPAAPQSSDERVTCDVQLHAIADANGVIRWLDTLARQHPYVSFEHVALRQGRDGACDLQAVFRLHMLPAEPDDATAEARP